jgi:transposase
MFDAAVGRVAGWEEGGGGGERAAMPAQRLDFSLYWIDERENMQINRKRRQQIIDLRNQGMTRRQIASHLGISKDLVGSYLHQLIREGIVAPISRQQSLIRRKTAANKVDVQAARQMRMDGKSYNEIAKHYGVSGPTIQKMIGSGGRITQIQRRLIDLRLQGLSYAEIAAQVGKPPGTVAVILSRLVKKGLIPGGHPARPKGHAD